MESSWSDGSLEFKQEFFGGSVTALHVLHPQPLLLASIGSTLSLYHLHQLRPLITKTLSREDPIYGIRSMGPHVCLFGSKTVSILRLDSSHDSFGLETISQFEMKDWVLDIALFGMEWLPKVVDKEMEGHFLFAVAHSRHYVQIWLQNDSPTKLKSILGPMSCMMYLTVVS